MSRQDFIGNFLTEHFTVFVDGQEVDRISAGGWANLEDIMKAAETNLSDEVMAGKLVLTRYINIEKNHIMFWTYKDNEWWTL